MREREEDEDVMRMMVVEFRKKGSQTEFRRYCSYTCVYLTLLDFMSTANIALVPQPLHPSHW